MTPQPLPKTFPFCPDVLFTDVDETLTWNNRLPAETFAALENLHQAGIKVIPVTGASAGWCDCMIRTWPIETIIGENGSFYFNQESTGRLSRRYALAENERYINNLKLQRLKKRVLEEFSQACETTDQAYRETDIAFDIGQDQQVERSEAAKITRFCRESGYEAKMSSIHINVWCGRYSKSSMAMKWLETHQIKQDRAIFIGDSPNDESMFESFRMTVGVSNISPYIVEMKSVPTFVTTKPGGYGFTQLADAILKN